MDQGEMGTAFYCVLRFTEALQSYVHAVNGVKYRICSRREQVFFADVHDLNVLVGKASGGTGIRFCVTAPEGPQCGGAQEGLTW